MGVRECVCTRMSMLACRINNRYQSATAHRRRKTLPELPHRPRPATPCASACACACACTGMRSGCFRCVLCFSPAAFPSQLLLPSLLFLLFVAGDNVRQSVKQHTGYPSRGILLASFCPSPPLFQSFHADCLWLMWRGA